MFVSGRLLILIVWGLCLLQLLSVIIKVASRWGLEDGGSEGQRNSILQKAISLYVGQLGLKYDNALVVLGSVKEKGKLDQESYNMVRKPIFVFVAAAVAVAVVVVILMFREKPVVGYTLRTSQTNIFEHGNHNGKGQMVVGDEHQTPYKIFIIEVTPA